MQLDSTRRPLPLVLNSSLIGVIEQDTVASTAAFHINILVGVSLHRSEAVVAVAFLASPLLSAARCTGPLPAIPLVRTSVFPLF